MGKFVEKGELKEEKTVIMGRIKTVSDFSEAATSGLFIEAVFENIDLKREIFEKMDGLLLGLKLSSPAIPLLFPSLKSRSSPRGPNGFSVFTSSVPYP